MAESLRDMTLHVANVQPWMDKCYLKNSFGKYSGLILSVQLINPSDDNRYASIEFTSVEIARLVLNKFQGEIMPDTNQKFELIWRKATYWDDAHIQKFKNGVSGDSLKDKSSSYNEVKCANRSRVNKAQRDRNKGLTLQNAFDALTGTNSQADEEVLLLQSVGSSEITEEEIQEEKKQKMKDKRARKKEKEKFDKQASIAEIEKAERAKDFLRSEREKMERDKLPKKSFFSWLLSLFVNLWQHKWR